MAGDIEEFLRRAAQRRAVRQPPEIQILGDDDVVDADIVDADIVEDPGILTGHDVGSHVSQHIDTTDFAERISHLGEVVDRADDRMEAHLQGYFEHKLGDLGVTTSRTSESTLDDDKPRLAAPEVAPQTPPFDIQKLLRSPASIRDAIVLSEVLKRPEGPW